MEWKLLWRSIAEGRIIMFGVLVLAAIVVIAIISFAINDWSTGIICSVGLIVFLYIGIRMKEE